jgi:hypothetical protein
MKPEKYANENFSPSRARCFESRLVCIETPGYSGTGYITLPAEQLVRCRWLGPDILREWVLEEVVQIMHAVLASDRHERGPQKEALLSLTEFAELEFSEPVDMNREIQCQIRIHARLGGISLGIFVAYQGTDLIAAGKLIAQESSSP